MTLSFDSLAAIYALSVALSGIDGEVEEAEVKEIFDFMMRFEGMDAENFAAIIARGEQLSPMDALLVLSSADDMPDDEARQAISNLFARIVCADGTLTEEERDIYQQLQAVMDLPDPEIPDEEEEGDEEIQPAFLIVRSDSSVLAVESETDGSDWRALDDEMADWLGVERLEVVRFTQPLNALSEALGLEGCHLVFLMDRNAAQREAAADNVAASLLYGGGYPLYGDIIVALESDRSNLIEGCRSMNQLLALYSAVNDAVGGLLRLADDDE